MSRRALAILLTVAAALRLLFIWRAQLWYDENFTLLVTRLPWDSFWAALFGDVHPPLYYLILKPLATVPAPWLLRLPSVCFSVLAVFVFARVLMALRAPKPAAIAALLLMTVLPMQLWYAQEARMYALLELLFLLGVLAVLERRWYLLTVSIAGMLYTQNYGLFYGAVLGLLGLTLYKGRDVTKLLTAGIVGGAVWLPWAYVLTRQMGAIDGRYWITPVTPGTLLHALTYQFYVSALPQEVIVSAWLATLAALSYGATQMIRTKARQAPALMLLAFGPLVLSALASMIWTPVFLPRALIGSSPFLYLLICWPLESLWINDSLHKFMTGVVMGQAQVEGVKPGFEFSYELRTRMYFMPSLFLSIFAAPLLIAGLGGTYLYSVDLKESGNELPIGGALAYIQAHARPGDVIYHTQDGSLINMLPYSPELTHVRMPDCGVTRGQLTFETIRALGTPVMSLDEYRALSGAGAQSKGRAWVIIGISPLVDGCYPAAVAAYMDHDPALVIDDNEYLYSGVWLEE